MRKIVQYSEENYRIMEVLLRDAMTDLRTSEKIEEDYYIRMAYDKLSELYYIYLTDEG